VHIAEPVIAPNEELYTIVGIEPDVMGGSTVMMRLSQGVAMRRVIEYLNPRYNILGFEELLPTMHEIFIETVTAK
jgi:hypothetical protein